MQVLSERVNTLEYVIFIYFFKERLGHDSPLEDSIEMLCLPLGPGVATLGRVAGEIRVNSGEWC